MEKRRGVRGIAEHVGSAHDEVELAVGRLNGDFGTVGGGRANTAGDDYATVAGGESNTAGGVQSTVGGGSFNEACQKSSPLRVRAKAPSGK